MAQVQVGRRLVKSPPELWAELSDLESLARHLGEFGQIRITRLEPETTVAWEGDRARGTVKIEGTGWGTKVILTVEAERPPSEPAQIVRHSPAYAYIKPALIKVEPRPIEPAERQAPPVTSAPPSATPPEPAQPSPAAPEPVASPPAAPVRLGLIERLFRRLRGEPVAAPPTRPEPTEPEAIVEEEPIVAEQPIAAAEPIVEEDRILEAVVEPIARPLEEQQPDNAPEPSHDETHLRAVLATVLDNLGAAHHRPFSRG